MAKFTKCGSEVPNFPAINRVEGEPDVFLNQLPKFGHNLTVLNK